jgi:catechol-2,3-dioxygenase
MRWRPNSWVEHNTPLASRTSASIYRFSILHRNRNRLAWAPGTILDTGNPLGGVSDHSSFKSLSLHNPDDNSVQLYRDHARELLPGDEEANPAMVKQTLDARVILAELDGAARGG